MTEEEGGSVEMTEERGQFSPDWQKKRKFAGKYFDIGKNRVYNRSIQKRRSFLC